jgi:5-formyltetrahydrofolate cyclo-ligase
MLLITKVELRKIMRNLVIDSANLRQEQDHLLAAFMKEPTCLGLFAPLENEINLDVVFPMIKSLGINVAYPRINGDLISFHEVKALEELRLGNYGIREPNPLVKQVVPNLVVVPGLAFSKTGKRLGRGKGHYDRYLKANPTPTISIVFSWQLFADIPTEAHDMTIDTVLWH